MPQIKPTQVSTFSSDLRKVISNFEGDVRRIYIDQKWIPTMGVGFALFTRSVSVNKTEHYDYRQTKKGTHLFNRD